MPEKSGDIETSKNSLEFRASIIPYDSCKDPNAPILATSGDNINLIFNIPKKSFLKLASAAVAHLSSNLDSEHTGILNVSSKESDNNEHKTSSKAPKFRLSDVVNNLESENTKDIIDAYEEDSNTSESSKNKEDILADPKLCVNGGFNGSLEHGDESVPNDFGTGNKSQSVKNESDRVETLPDHNLDLSDCPNLENAWPDIHPFTETEKIPIKEIESLVLNGFITKYLKLELSNEFVILKITSESNVLVDAVKYKESRKESTQETEEKSEDANAYNEHKDLSEKESECLVIDDGISKLLQTAKSNVDSMSETVSSIDDNESGKQINEYISCISDTMREIPVVVSVPNSASDIPEPKDLDIEATTGSSESLTENSSNLSTENDSNITTEVSNDLSEKKSEDETLELDTIEKLLENAEFEENGLKIEEKLEDLNINIPGSSPTERLKFALRECLKISPSNVDSKKQTEESVANIPQILSENSDAKDASENSNLQIQDKCLEDSLVCGAESSEICDSNEMTAEYNENYDKKSNAEGQSPKTGSEHGSVSPVNRPILNSTKDESVTVKQDSTAVGKLDLNDDFTSENSLHVDETDIEKESFNEPLEENDSLEDSALGKDLNLSEIDVINDCSKLEGIECSQMNSKDVCSQEMSKSIPCEIKENGSMETCNEIAVKNDCTSNNHDIENEQCEQAVEENCCQAEVVTKSIKLENSLAGNTAEEKDESENTSTDDKTSAKNKYETNNSEFKSDELKDVKVKTEISPEIIADTNVEVTLNEASEPESEESSKSFEKESLEQSSVCLEDSVSETTDVEKIPDNSFASNADSFMDTTVDANVESASECGDLESDDVKSIASESDDSKDSGKQSSIRMNRYKKNGEADEVDCAPTRTRRKAISVLSKDAIPENTEIKNTKMSKRHTSTLDTPSKYSGRISPIGRSLRSKSLDPTPQSSNGNLYDKKHGIVESEEPSRRTRAKTPDVIGKKDIKTTARSSPRKLARSSATTEPSSASKVQNTKTSVADCKSRSNLDSSIATKRSKRGSKE